MLLTREDVGGYPQSLSFAVTHTSSEAIQSHRQGQMALLQVKSNSTLVWSHWLPFQIEINPLPFPDTLLGTAGCCRGSDPAWGGGIARLRAGTQFFSRRTQHPLENLVPHMRANVTKNIPTNEWGRVFLPYYLLWACWNGCSFHHHSICHRGESQSWADADEEK